MITLALSLWPIVIVICALRASWPVTIAVAFFGGYMLLPVDHGIDLPLLPYLDKYSIPIFTLVALALLLRPGVPGSRLHHAIAPALVRPGWLPRNKLALACLALWVGGVFLTVQTNRDALVFGPTVLPGLGLYDAFSMLVNAAASLLSLLLARKYLSHPEMHKLLLAAFAIAALIYAWPALYEVRMSPQLSNMIYGFFPHSFAQHMRGGGFRPVVFLEHGLWLSMFLSLGLLSLVSFAKLGATGATRLAAVIGAVFLLGVLVLTKTLGALLIALAIIPIILFFPTRLQAIAAAVIAMLVLLYPMARSLDVIPVDRVVSFAQSIDADRARSLIFRIEQEDALLARANERPLFGWGGWSRNRVFDEGGRNVSVTDGYWLIIFGTGGWALYLAAFGLLLLPLLLLAGQSRHTGLAPPTVYLGLVLAANAVDLLPNAGQIPITWLLAGAIWGYLEQRVPKTSQTEDMPDARPDTDPSRAPPRSAGLIYTRQEHRHMRKPHSAPLADRR